MGEQKFSVSQALTFDDVLLLPGYSDFSRSEIRINSKLTKNISLTIPFVSAPMDTVTGSSLAIALARLGGIGIIHRNLSTSEQVKEILKVKKSGLIVGAAIGSSHGYEKRVEKLIAAGADVIVVDSAHGFSRPVIEAVKFIKRKYPNSQVIAGNIATKDGARALIAGGADALRVGMGPGAICTTRVVSGMGVPQLTAIREVATVAKSHRVPIIADGGIRYSGDIVKALAAGASSVMMGSIFAATTEAPGKKILLLASQVPSRFKSIFLQSKKRYQLKEYRGMGSVGAMEQGSRVKSEDEFHGKDYIDKVLVAEGVEGLIPVEGSVEDRVEQLMGGIRSGMYYIGAKTLSELSRKANFIQITAASLQESHPHNLFVTNPGKSYS